MRLIMKKIISAILIGAVFSVAAYAGFSIGMTGAFKKQVKKLDAKVQANSANSSSTVPPTAGGEWIYVPGNSSIGTSNFWVMKYEAKDVGGAATSQAALTPWVSI